MKFAKVALAAAAASFATAPVAVAAERVAAPVDNESEIGGDGGVSIAVVFALLVVALFVLVSGDDEPVSP